MPICRARRTAGPLPNKPYTRPQRLIYNIVQLVRLQRNGHLVTLACSTHKVCEIDPAQLILKGNLYAGTFKDTCHLIRSIRYSEDELDLIDNFCALYDIETLRLQDKSTNRGSRTNPIIIEDDQPGDSKENPIELD